MVLQLGRPAHDVGRAAGAAEPGAPQQFPARLRAAALVVVGPALEGVVVEEGPSVEGGADREGVEQHPFDDVEHVRPPGREEQPPSPLHGADRRAGLRVRAFRGQLVPVADGLVGVAAAEAPGEVQLRGDHVVPQRLDVREQRGVPEFDGDVGGSGRQVHHPHGVAGDRVQRAQRHLVLEVRGREDGGLQPARAAAFDEQLGLPQVRALPGLPVQLDERHLHLGVAAVQRLAVVPEPPHDVVGEPPRHPQQPVVPELPRRGQRGLDEVAEVVQLVAPFQVLPGGLGGVRTLEPRRQVAVGGLGPLDQPDAPLPELFGRGVGPAAGEFVDQPLQGLVDVGVQERVAPPVGRRRAFGHPPEVVQVARAFHLPHGVGEGRGPVAFLPLRQEPAAQFDVPRAERPSDGGDGGDRGGAGGPGIGGLIGTAHAGLRLSQLKCGG